MVITITMKNYVIRNGIYYFRLAVPKGCQSEVGKREILQSLKTSDELEAAVAYDIPIFDFAKFSQYFKSQYIRMGDRMIVRQSVFIVMSESY